MRLSQAESRSALGLYPNRKVLAVLGGSQGASVLNAWTRAHLPQLAAEGIQVYCLTGLDKGTEETFELMPRPGRRSAPCSARSATAWRSSSRRPTW